MSLLVNISTATISKERTSGMVSQPPNITFGQFLLPQNYWLISTLKMKGSHFAKYCVLSKAVHISVFSFASSYKLIKSMTT